MLCPPRRKRIGALLTFVIFAAVLLIVNAVTDISVNSTLSAAKSHLDNYTKKKPHNGADSDRSDLSASSNGFSSSEILPSSTSTATTPLSTPHSSMVAESTGASSRPIYPTGKNDNRLENATMYTLCQNKDLYEMVESVRSVEEKFNNQYHYDWVFLNNEDFTADFMDAIREAASGEVFFGKIDNEGWGYPEYIDLDKAAQTREWMKEHEIIYGDLESYHHMCRFQSGYFFRHPLMMRYKYAWRVEPGIRILCYQNYDPFNLMRRKELIYGFNVALKEIPKTVKGLWKSVQDFVKEGDHKKYLDPNNLEDFVATKSLKKYNYCHFWTNFEISDMDWLRGEAYMNLFNYLDKSGGFYYERWGDAPIRSIAVSLFAPADKIHFFNEIGYYHEPFGHCPYNQGPLELKCDCKVQGGEFSDKYFDYTKNSCLRDYFKAKGQTFRDENPWKKDY